MAATNFSRPRRPSEGQAGQRAINTLSVVSERDEDLPSEPRLSYDSARDVSHNQYADVRGQGQTMRTQPLGVRDQRYPGGPNNGSRNNPIRVPDSLNRAGYSNPTLPVPPDSPNTAGMSRRESDRGSTQYPGLSRKNSSSTTGTSRPPASSRTNSASTSGSTKQQPFVPKSILKVTTVEQTSERSASRSGSAAGSSSKSSDSGSIPVSYDSEGKFVASDYDTSELSEKEIKKMQKKGINPALALEMKSLRKGKSIGNLVGNAYVA